MNSIAKREEDQRNLHLDLIEALKKKEETQCNLHRNQMARIAMKEEAQRNLHRNQMVILEKKIADLETSVESKNGEYVNKQKWWQSSWKCLVCKTKTKTVGRWTCPSCRFRQRNEVWEEMEEKE